MGLDQSFTGFAGTPGHTGDASQVYQPRSTPTGLDESYLEHSDFGHSHHQHATPGHPNFHIDEEEKVEQNNLSPDK
jgi:hypothetical protein